MLFFFRLRLLRSLLRSRRWWRTRDSKRIGFRSALTDPAKVYVNSPTDACSAGMTVTMPMLLASLMAFRFGGRPFSFAALRFVGGSSGRLRSRRSRVASVHTSARTWRTSTRTTGTCESDAVENQCACGDCNCNKQRTHCYFASELKGSKNVCPFDSTI